MLDKSLQVFYFDVALLKNSFKSNSGFLPWLPNIDNIKQGDLYKVNVLQREVVCVVYFDQLLGIACT